MILFRWGCEPGQLGTKAHGVCNGVTTLPSSRTRTVETSRPSQGRKAVLAVTRSQGPSMRVARPRRKPRLFSFDSLGKSGVK